MSFGINKEIIKIPGSEENRKSLLLGTFRDLAFFGILGGDLGILHTNVELKQ